MWISMLIFKIAVFRLQRKVLCHDMRIAWNQYYIYRQSVQQSVSFSNIPNYFHHVLSHNQVLISIFWQYENKIKQKRSSNLYSKVRTFGRKKDFEDRLFEMMESKIHVVLEKVLRQRKQHQMGGIFQFEKNYHSQLKKKFSKEKKTEKLIRKKTRRLKQTTLILDRNRRWMPKICRLWSVDLKGLAKRSNWKDKHTMNSKMKKTHAVQCRKNVWLQKNDNAIETQSSCLMRIKKNWIVALQRKATTTNWRNWIFSEKVKSALQN